MQCQLIGEQIEIKMSHLSHFLNYNSVMQLEASSAIKLEHRPPLEGPVVLLTRYLTEYIFRKIHSIISSILLL